MKKSEFIAVVIIAGLSLTGCISSTTTGSIAPESDADDAAEYNYQLGARYYQSQSYELARDRLERAVDLDPKLAKAYMTLGMTYEALDNNRLATQAYKNAIDAAPRGFNTQNANYGEALLQLCLLKYRQQDYLNARAFLQRFMGSNPMTAGVLLLAADIEEKLGNETGRMEFVNQLLREFPDSPEARRVLSSG